MRNFIQKHKNQFFRSVFLLLITVVLCSHDLYVKMNSYFLKPNHAASLSLYNGTFERSENIITRDRMLDASLLFQGKRLPIDESQWSDKDSTITYFDFTPYETGTYVAGVSTKARNINLSAKKFNDYLQHDGVLDMLAYRKTNNLLDADAVESYQKHVKAIFQVGDARTNDWSTVLGYPIEFVPLENPYEKYTGDQLKVKLLLDGKPLSNQLVYANYKKTLHNHDHGDHGHDHNHGHDEDEHSHNHSHDHTHDHSDDASKSDNNHSHTDGQKLRTDADGIITVNLPEDGVYYLRTIHMTNVVDSDELTHESKWATLTFEVTHNHEHHHHEEGLPTWVFILGSMLLIVVLFLIFRKKNS